MHCVTDQHWLDSMNPGGKKWLLGNVNRLLNIPTEHMIEMAQRDVYFDPVELKFVGELLFWEANGNTEMGMIEGAQDIGGDKIPPVAHQHDAIEQSDASNEGVLSKA